MIGTEVGPAPVPLTVTAAARLELVPSQSSSSSSPSSLSVASASPLLASEAWAAAELELSALPPPLSSASPAVMATSATLLALAGGRLDQARLRARTMLYAYLALCMHGKIVFSRGSSVPRLPHGNGGDVGGATSAFLERARGRTVPVGLAAMRLNFCASATAGVSGETSRRCGEISFGGAALELELLRPLGRGAFGRVHAARVLAYNPTVLSHALPDLNANATVRASASPAGCRDCTEGECDCGGVAGPVAYPTQPLPAVAHRALHLSPAQRAALLSASLPAAQRGAPLSAALLAVKLVPLAQSPQGQPRRNINSNNRNRRSNCSGNGISGVRSSLRDELDAANADAPFSIATARKPRWRCYRRATSVATAAAAVTATASAENSTVIDIDAIRTIPAGLDQSVLTNHSTLRHSHARAVGHRGSSSASLAGCSDESDDTWSSNDDDDDDDDDADAADADTHARSCSDSDTDANAFGSDDDESCGSDGAGGGSAHCSALLDLAALSREVEFGLRCGKPLLAAPAPLPRLALPWLARGSKRALSASASAASAAASADFSDIPALLSAAKPALSELDEVCGAKFAMAPPPASASAERDADGPPPLPPLPPAGDLLALPHPGLAITVAAVTTGLRRAATPHGDNQSADARAAKPMLCVIGEWAPTDLARVLRAARALADIRLALLFQLDSASVNAAAASTSEAGGAVQRRVALAAAAGAMSPLSERAAAHALQQMLSALCALHCAGVAHLDVKPANALLDRVPDLFSACAAQHAAAAALTGGHGGGGYGGGGEGTATVSYTGPGAVLPAEAAEALLLPPPSLLVTKKTTEGSSVNEHGDAVRALALAAEISSAGGLMFPTSAPTAGGSRPRRPLSGACARLTDPGSALPLPALAAALEPARAAASAAALAYEPAAAARARVLEAVRAAAAGAGAALAPAVSKAYAAPELGLAYNDLHGWLAPVRACAQPLANLLLSSAPARQQRQQQHAACSRVAVAVAMTGEALPADDGPAVLESAWGALDRALQTAAVEEDGGPPRWRALVSAAAPKSAASAVAVHARAVAAAAAAATAAAGCDVYSAGVSLLELITGHSYSAAPRVALAAVDAATHEAVALTDCGIPVGVSVCALTPEQTMRLCCAAVAEELALVSADSNAAYTGHGQVQGKSRRARVRAAFWRRALALGGYWLHNDSTGSNSNASGHSGVAGGRWRLRWCPFAGLSAGVNALLEACLHPHPRQRATAPEALALLQRLPEARDPQRRGALDAEAQRDGFPLEWVGVTTKPRRLADAAQALSDAAALRSRVAAERSGGQQSTQSAAAAVALAAGLWIRLRRALQDLSPAAHDIMTLGPDSSRPRSLAAAGSRSLETSSRLLEGARPSRALLLPRLVPSALTPQPLAAAAASGDSASAVLVPARSLWLLPPSAAPAAPVLPSHLDVCFDVFLAPAQRGDVNGSLGLGRSSSSPTVSSRGALQARVREGCSAEEIVMRSIAAISSVAPAVPYNAGVNTAANASAVVKSSGLISHCAAPVLMARMVPTAALLTGLLPNPRITTLTVPHSLSFKSSLAGTGTQPAAAATAVAAALPALRAHCAAWVRATAAQPSALLAAAAALEREAADLFAKRGGAGPAASKTDSANTGDDDDAVMLSESALTEALVLTRVRSQLAKAAKQANSCSNPADAASAGDAAVCPLLSLLSAWDYALAASRHAAALLVLLWVALEAAAVASTRHAGSQLALHSASANGNSNSSNSNKKPSSAAAAAAAAAASAGVAASLALPPPLPQLRTVARDVLARLPAPPTSLASVEGSNSNSAPSNRAASGLALWALVASAWAQARANAAARDSNGSGAGVKGDVVTVDSVWSTMVAVAAGLGLRGLSATELTGSQSVSQPQSAAVALTVITDSARASVSLGSAAVTVARTAESEREDAEGADLEGEGCARRIAEEDENEDGDNGSDGREGAAKVHGRAFMPKIGSGSSKSHSHRKDINDKDAHIAGNALAGNAPVPVVPLSELPVAALNLVSPASLLWLAAHLAAAPPVPSLWIALSDSLTSDAPAPSTLPSPGGAGGNIGDAVVEDDENTTLIEPAHVMLQMTVPSDRGGSAAVSYALPLAALLGTTGSDSADGAESESALSASASLSASANADCMVTLPRALVVVAAAGRAAARRRAQLARWIRRAARTVEAEAQAEAEAAVKTKIEAEADVAVGRVSQPRDVKLAAAGAAADAAAAAPLGTSRITVTRPVLVLVQDKAAPRAHAAERAEAEAKEGQRGPTLGVTIETSTTQHQSEVHHQSRDADNNADKKGDNEALESPVSVPVAESILLSAAHGNYGESFVLSDSSTANAGSGSADSGVIGALRRAGSAFDTVADTDAADQISPPKPVFAAAPDVASALHVAVARLLREQRQQQKQRQKRGVPAADAETQAAAAASEATAAAVAGTVDVLGRMFAFPQQ